MKTKTGTDRKQNGIDIYDTTLRDGAQGEGISFSVADKLHIAEKLDAFGVHYIEGGWPGANPKDIEFFEKAKRRKWKAQLSSFGMTRRRGQAVERDELIRQILKAETPVVTIVGKSWLLHVLEVLRVSCDENIAMIAETIRYLKDHDKTVIYDAEHAFDGFKDNPKYAMATWQVAEKAGADCVCLCDTNGGCLPVEIERIMTEARSKLSVELGIHTHNDCGLGVANGMAGLQAGATHIQGTINGYGERTGNCNLTSVIPLVAFKLKKIGVPSKSLPKLRELSLFVDEIANMSHDSRQPWVGQSAFAHKGGMHAHAVERLAESYEHIDPALVGGTRRVLVGELSGKANIRLKARELGIPVSDFDLPAVVDEVKKLEHQGYEFEVAEASLALVIRHLIEKKRRPFFSIKAFHLSMRSNGGHSVCEATVKVVVDGKLAHTVSEGDGPVNALDRALRGALIQFYPTLNRVQLIDYKVRTLDGTRGTAASTRTLILSSDGEREWGTVGVSTNSVKASLKALVDSFEFALISGAWVP